MKKKKRSATAVFVLIALIVFILVFTYLSLNLKNIDFGYDLQALLEKERQLKEEIARLKAVKASLLNLERVERKVTRELGFRYPQPHQFIKVFDERGRK